MKCFPFFVFVLITHLAFADKFPTIQSFQDVTLNDLTSSSLVVFDVDDVLVTPADVLLKPEGGAFEGWKQVSQEQLEESLSIMLAGTEYLLADPNAPEIIDTLTKKGISAMALTSCRTGAFGVIPSMEQWRFDQLNAIGIDFSPFVAHEHVFVELVDGNAHPPLFKNGILFCGDFYDSRKSKKGELLGIFLDHMNLKPDRVVFIDDEEKNLQAVSQELEKRGVLFQGYLFKIPSVKLDERVAQLQLETLLSQKKWISDKEARRE
jgi:hypothetical protein